MLVIRSDQIDAMRESRIREYCLQLASFFQRKTPNLVGAKTPDELEGAISLAVRKAQALKITSAEGMFLYVALALATDLQFDNDPIVEAFLTHPRVPVDRKIRRLYQKTIVFLHEMMS